MNSVLLCYNVCRDNRAMEQGICLLRNLKLYTNVIYLT